MGGGSIPVGLPTQSSLLTGIFAFNLIIGVGALALPYALNTVGWLLGALLVGIVCVLGYVTATFVMEAMGNASAIKAIQDAQSVDLATEASGDSYKQSLLMAATPSHAPSHSVPQEEGGDVKHFELAAMVELLFPTWGQVLFYMVICVYLYGDLAIYAVAVPTTLAHFSGVKYEYFLAGFAVCMVPWVFFDFQKTKYLQYATLATRNVALLLMIVLTISFISEGNGDTDVSLVKPGGVSVAWGGIVYAFMCHHSIPSMVSPMKNKHQAARAFLVTFILVAVVYWLLCLTAIFAFANEENKTCKTHPSDPCVVQNLYTENFSSFDLQWIAHFLTLFPVFTLSSSFPMIALTLRNNLLTLFNRLNILTHAPQTQLIVCALLSPCPPLLLGFFVKDLSQLVGFTGSYAGMGIMFIVPTLLVHTSRKRVLAVTGKPVMHALRSPFQSNVWVWVILLWSALCLGIISANNIRKLVE